MKVKAGDIVYANLWSVHHPVCPCQFSHHSSQLLVTQGEQEANVDGHGFLYGVGFHRCPASKFVKEVSLTFLLIFVIDVGHPDNARGINAS